MNGNRRKRREKRLKMEEEMENMQIHSLTNSGGGYKKGGEKTKKLTRQKKTGRGVKT